MDGVEIIVTADGSHSLVNTTLEETYHSRHGARSESLHVFIRNGLDYYLDRHGPELVNVLEVGFGTGLNALLTLHRSRSANATIRYTTVEPYPVTSDIWSRLNYSKWQDHHADDFPRLHELSWAIEHTVDKKFIIHKVKETIQGMTITPGQFDVVYFDAFAPDKQPELWSLDTLSKIELSMRPGGVLVTYSAKGQVRRNLRSLGMLVESLPGAPGKKEMTRASKN